MLVKIDLLDRVASSTAISSSPILSTATTISTTDSSDAIDNDERLLGFKLDTESFSSSTILSGNGNNSSCNDSNSS